MQEHKAIKPEVLHEKTGYRVGFYEHILRSIPQKNRDGKGDFKNQHDVNHAVKIKFVVFCIKPIHKAREMPRHKLFIFAKTYKIMGLGSHLKKYRDYAPDWQKRKVEVAEAMEARLSRMIELLEVNCNQNQEIITLLSRQKTTETGQVWGETKP